MNIRLKSKSHLRSLLLCATTVFLWPACAAEPNPGDDSPTAGTGAGGSGVPPGVGGSSMPGVGGAVNMTGGTGGMGLPPGAGAGGAGGAVAGGTGGGGGIPTIPENLRSSWMSFGGDLSHTRWSSAETMIAVDNVKDLKVAFDIKAPGVTSTPALHKGVIYWGDWGGFVHATNLEDQKDVWTKDNSATVAGHDLNGGYTGSLAVTDTAVYAANRNGLLSAYDRVTGEVIWEQTIDAGPHTHIWSSPIVVEKDHILIVGVGGIGTRDNGVALPSSQLATFHGSVRGFDSLTGAPMWTFETTPDPDGAGVSVWSSAAVDETRQLAFIGTGNNYYTPVSKYSDSLLALNYVTGEYKWNVQFSMNDAFTVGTVIAGGVDGDVGATPNLFAIAGRDVVGVGDKQGGYHVHDRETGAEVWTRPLTRGGYQGGVMAPAAYHDGVVYVVSNNDTINSTVFALDANAQGAILWQKNLSQPTFGAPALGNGVLYVGDVSGAIVGYNAATGDPVWTATVPERAGGFSLVDGMLFTGYGYHFSESRREPLMGGLLAFSLTGSVAVPTSTNMSDCVAGTALTADPTFTNVYQGVLCATGCANVCHGTAMTAGLRLDKKAIAYQSLVGAPTMGEACVVTAGQKLVVAGNPAQSVLHSKLAATPLCGATMPPGATAADTPVTPAMLKVLSDWITAGALDN